MARSNVECRKRMSNIECCKRLSNVECREQMSNVESECRMFGMLLANVMAFMISLRSQPDQSCLNIDLSNVSTAIITIHQGSFDFVKHI